MNTARPFKKIRSVNSSSANFPTWVSTEFDPAFADVGTAAGRCLARLSAGPGGGGVTPSGIMIFPYGLGSDNDVFVINVVGYRQIAEPIADQRRQYIRELVAKLTCTISAAVGLVGGQVINTERFADTIVLTNEPSYTSDVTRAGTVRLFSPANDTPGWAIVPLVGIEGIEFEWDQTTGTPTMNALVSFLDDVD